MGAWPRIGYGNILPRPVPPGRCFFLRRKAGHREGGSPRSSPGALETLLTDLLENRVAAFDSAAAAQAAALMAARQKKGLPGELRDTMIAGIVLATHATLATRNVRHFEDRAISVMNPWEP